MSSYVEVEGEKKLQRCSCAVAGTEGTVDSDNYIQLVRENTQKAENGENLTNSVKQCKHVQTAKGSGREELNPILRTGNNFLIIQQQESNLAK